MIASMSLILVAGALAYTSYGAGEAGPMVMFGHGDANIAAAEAWHQLPLHAAVGLGFAVAGPLGIRRIPWTASVLATATMGLWALYLTIGALAALGGDGTDILDVAVSATLLGLYATAVIASWS